MHIDSLQTISKVPLGSIGSMPLLKLPVKLMSKSTSRLGKECKLKTRQSVETGYQSKMHKCTSFTNRNGKQTVGEERLNPQASRRSVGLMDLDLKGRLMEHEWRPICRNPNRQRHPNTPLIIKRKDHFLTVMSRLPLNQHQYKTSH